MPPYGSPPARPPRTWPPAPSARRCGTRRRHALIADLDIRVIARDTGELLRPW